jgi:trans-aconitate 2-methyltransferase
MKNEEPPTPEPRTAVAGRRARRAYAFGDAETAARRLHLMDAVFAAPNRTLLDLAGPDRPGLAVDLGCGPGYSTRLVAARLHPVRLVGLDASPAFLAQAHAGGLRAEWLCHDVTVVPLPTGPADLLHARFVLSHLADPESVLSSWLRELTPGGCLLVQDDDVIETDHPVLVAYEQMARSLVARRGGDLWVGSRLDAFEPPAGVERVTSAVYPHRVAIARAAQMFSMNFAVWRHHADVVAAHPAAELDELGRALGALTTSKDPGEVVFRLRQLGYRRSGVRPAPR